MQKMLERFSFSGLCETALALNARSFTPAVAACRSPQECPAIHMDGLPVDEAAAGSAQEPHQGRDILGGAVFPAERAVELVVLGRRQGGIAPALDEAGRNAVHRHGVG